MPETFVQGFNEVYSDVAWYVRCLTRGVPRYYKDAYLYRRYLQACQSGNAVESAVIYAFLSTKQILETRVRVSFNFNSLADRDCVARFRLHKHEIELLVRLLRIGEVRTRERTHSHGIEALCVLLYKLAVPVRWADLEVVFGRSPSGLSNLFLHIMADLHRRYRKQLYFNRNYAAQHAQEFADAVFNAGSHVTNVWSFIDGTVRGMCRPVPRNRRRDGRFLSQQSVYNGHKRKHAVKYQTIVTPDGMIAHIFGPFPGRNHDLKMYCESKISTFIGRDERFSSFRVFGDMAYGRDNVLECPFGGAIANMTAEQQSVNAPMSKVRVSVEWAYGQITNYWSALDFKRQLRSGVQPIGQMYLMGVLFTNCITCIRGGNTISDFFQVQPPSISQYLDCQ